MTPERWQQINDVFQGAVDLPPEERAAFLDEICTTDAQLRSELESLLASDGHEWKLLEKPALEVAAPLLADDRPQFPPDQNIGHYKVVSLIGRGGMGEVYLAKDEKLNRRIALKLLPIDYTRNNDRLQRFQQEAQAVSALNHPNILTIHELGEVDQKLFIATEFVDGETLRQRIKRGGLGLGEALDIAIQTASALAAAHKGGIVHRDIKPENIMLRPDGYVKVLDFGLAKLTEEKEPTFGARDVDNLDVSGLIMGTVKYMSPEQARGLHVDARSDVFSLGVVLYEMLTSHRPFKGEVAGDVSLSQIVPELPVELEIIVSKALAKNRAERYQAVNDLLVALTKLRRKQQIEQALDGVPHTESTVGISMAAQPRRSAVSASVTSPSITQQVLSPVTQHRLQTIVTFLLVLVAAGGIFYSLTMHRHKTAAFQEVKMSQLVETDKSQLVAISGDGMHIAHTVVDGNKWTLLLRPTVTNSNTVLVPPTEAWFSGVTFSRDGNYVYYVMWGKDDSTYALYYVPVSGGDSKKVLANVASPITFSPDGKRFAFVRNLSKEETGLFIANADGTEESLRGKRRSPSFFSPTGPSWSPDGTLIACAVFDEGPDGRAPFMNVVGVSVHDSKERTLTNGKWSKVLQVAWLSDNSGLIVAATEKGEGALLWLVSYPGGTSRQITNDPSNYPSNYNSISLTANSRTLVASRFEQRTNIWTALSGDSSEIKQITFGGNHRFQRLAWTPDGRIVFPSDASGNREIWMMDGNGSSLKQVTDDGRFNQLPTVSPDGRYIVYVSSSASGEGRHIWRMNIDGSDPIQLTHGEDEFSPQCSPDGRYVLYVSVMSQKSTIWKVSIDGGEPIQLTKEVSTWPVVSPDGMLVVCWWWLSSKSPPKIAVIPFEGGEPIKFIETLPGVAKDLPIRWTSNGEALIYCVTRNDISNIWSHPLGGGPAKQLTDFKSETIRGFDWSKDDRLLVSRGFTAREIVLMEDVSR